MGIAGSSPIVHDADRERLRFPRRIGIHSPPIRPDGWSGDPGATSKERLTSVFAGGPPGIRTPNLRIKSPLLCQIELEARRSLATEPLGFG